MFLAREFGVDVVAVDLWISDAEVRGTIEAAGVGARVETVQADARDLPFDEHQFDVIVSVDAFEYFGTDVRFLPGLLRCLRPAGRIASSVVKAGFAPVAAYSSTKARACSRVIKVMTVRPANARARNNAPALREGGDAVAVSFTLSLSPHGGAGWLGSRSEAQAPARVSVHRSRSADPPCAEHVSRPSCGRSGCAAGERWAGRPQRERWERCCAARIYAFEVIYVPVSLRALWDCLR